ncbi:MAG: hypothetical protein J0I06_09150 [Planctomycetes bacterium]|jgi:hypothetical protein|nr:hypothetical protein [Planctomycetota bacterium]
MARPKVPIDVLTALHMLAQLREMKRQNPDLRLFQFFADNELTPRHREFAKALEVLERKFEFPFVAAAYKNGGRTDLTAEAEAVLDRFEAAYLQFLNPEREKLRDRPARVGAWGAVLEAALAPALGRLGGEADGVPVAHARDLSSFPRAMQSLVDFRVDAIVALHDRDESSTAFHNLVSFTPCEVEVPLLVTWAGERKEVRVFPSGLPSQWVRCAPRAVRRRGDLILRSPFAALELAAAGFGAAVVVGLPRVRKRADELGLTTEPVAHVTPEQLGVFTRHPRESMVRAEVWGKVELVLAACSKP